MSKIISSKIRHRLRFAPDPNNTAFPTKPVFVETRLIREIAEYPKKVNYVSFDDIVEIEILLPNGTTKTIYSEPFNDSQVYLVSWGRGGLEKLASHWHDPIDVHPDVDGVVYVTPTSREQFEEQKTA